MSGSRPWRQHTKPRVSPDEVKFADFAGVVNTRSRKDIGMKALYVADNVVISDTKKVTRRDGFRAVRESGTVKTAYGLGGELYIVEGGSLIHVLSTEDRVLATGLTGAHYDWDKQNGWAYYVNGVEAGIVRGDTHLPWRLTVPTIRFVAAISATTVANVLNIGETYTSAMFRVCATHVTADGRETAPSDVVDLVAAPTTNLIRVGASAAYDRTNIYCTEADGTIFRLVAQTNGSDVTFNPARGGRELTTLNTLSMPEGATHVAFAKGFVAIGQYLPDLQTSVVWMSQPFAYHLFNLEKDYHPVTGEIAILLWNNAGLLIGTTKAIYQLGEEGELKQLADYGAVPGIAGDIDAQGMAYFWTERGICRAMPFENLTESEVGMAPGARVTASLVYINGMQQFMAVTQGGGTPFNVRKERT